MRRLFPAKQNAVWRVVRIAHGRGCALELSAAADRPRITRAERVELPDDKLAQSWLTGLRGAPAQFMLSPGEYQFLTVEAPNVPEAELKTALAWKLKDMLDAPAHEVTLDVLPVPAPEGRAPSLFAIAAPNAVVGRHMAKSHAAKLDLRVIDIPETAHRNLALCVAEPKRGLGLLAFDHAGSMFSVVMDGALYFSRRMDVRLEEIDGEGREAAYDRLALALQRSIDLIDRQLPHLSMSGIAVAGVHADCNLPDYLSQQLYTQVARLDLATLFDLDAAPDVQRAPHQYLDLLGAALRPMG
jgi:MSHA biogenesis protein MshI